MKKEELMLVMKWLDENINMQGMFDVKISEDATLDLYLPNMKNAVACLNIKKIYELISKKEEVENAKSKCR